MTTILKSKHIMFHTHLGNFQVIAEVEHSSKSQPKINLSKKKPLLNLPPGMGVLGCEAALLCINHSNPIKRITFVCDFDGIQVGGPCTGQYLEAQMWESSEHIAIVGTEDSEMLMQRLPWLRLKEYQPIVTYSENSMQMEFLDIPSNREVTLHYIIAENLFPEPAPDSAWFAVDYPHKNLTSRAG